MPWLDDGQPQSIVDALNNTKKALWPRDETNRSDARFRHLLGEGMPYPRPSRWVVRIVPDTALPTVFRNGWLDLSAISDTVLTGSTGMSAEGYQMDLTLTSYGTTVDPNFGFNGIEYDLTFLSAGGDTFFYKYMIPVDEPTFFYETIPLDWLWSPDQFNEYQYVTTDYTLGMQPDFPNNNLGHALSLFSVSECWSFPAPPVAGFAEFNGIDAYIENRSITLNTNTQWRHEFDIRLHENPDVLYLAKSFNTTKYCLISPVRIIYRGRIVTFSTALNLNQWYHIDFRYEWLSADGLYRVAIDGGADDTLAHTGVADRWDRFGKRGSSTVIGKFDMRNFVLTNGPASSAVVFLDQNFDVNACDAGPDGRDGDTFFMSLPSCP